MNTVLIFLLYITGVELIVKGMKYGNITLDSPYCFILSLGYGLDYFDSKKYTLKQKFSVFSL